MKRAALYVRVSTAEQKNHGLSVDNQIMALTDYCKENNIAVAGVYNDAGISARKRYTRRPELLRLMDDCKAGRVSLVLFTKLDRWFRSVADYYEVQTILDACGVPWRAIWEDYETETSAGVLKVNIMLSVAQSEADRTSERIRDAIRYKKARGDYVGKAPFGYIKHGRELIKDPELAPAVDALFRTFLLTHSTADAMRRAAELGLRTDRGTINKMMMRTVYCGIAAGGYQCEPYITQAEHDLIVDLRRQRTRKPKFPGRVFLFAGLCRCGICGIRMTAKTRYRTRVNGDLAEMKYYECPAYQGTTHYHHPFSCVEHKIETQLLENLESALRDYTLDIEARNRSADKGSAERQKAALRGKLKRLQMVYIDGGLTDTEYETQRDAINAAIASIVSDTLPVPKPLPEEWRETYDDLDAVHKSRFWHTIIKSITVHSDRHISIEFR